MQDKMYIGDGVYARLDPNLGVCLTVENGIETTDAVYLDDSVLSAFIVWLRAVGKIK